MPRVFRFKQFEVNDYLSTMKVGTDAVLLGAWANPPVLGSILDVGTGCGVLALMIAQKSEAKITAIDVHQPSVNQAAENFATSPWSKRLNSCKISLEELAQQQNQSYDFVISNPPFFLDSLKPATHNQVLAKHTATGFVEVFLNATASLLKTDGHCAFIVTPQVFEIIRSKLIHAGLYLHRLAWVSTKACSKPTRVMLQAGRRTEFFKEESIFIRDALNHYTEQYKTLTQDFYLFLNE